MSARKSYCVAPNPTDVPNAGVPVGSITMFAGATAPDGWLLCNGSELFRSQYPELFAVIGNNFGIAHPDTFLLPNMNGQTVRGPIPLSLPYTLGTTGGNDSVLLQTSNLAPHSHTVWRGGVKASIVSTGDFIGTPNVDTGFATGGVIYGATDTPTSGSRTQVVGQGGEGQAAVNVINSYLALNFIIKYI